MTARRVVILCNFVPIFERFRRNFNLANSRRAEEPIIDTVDFVSFPPPAMQLKKTFSGLMIVALAAVAGVALMGLPALVISYYETAKSYGSVFGWIYLVVVGTGGLLLFGSLSWTVWKLWGASILKQRRKIRRSRNPSELSDSQKAAELEENLEQIEGLKSRTSEIDSKSGQQFSGQLDPLLQELEYKRKTQELEIVAFGNISSGKSSVLNLLAGNDVFATDARGGTTVTRNEIPWSSMDKVTLVDTPGLGEVDGEAHVYVSAESAKDADLVLLVVDGPLRDSEFKLLKKLGGMEKRIIVCLNKTDWYSDEDRAKLIGQIDRQTDGIVRDQDIVAIQAQPGSRIRKRILTDGTEVDETVEIPADIAPLADQMLAVLKSDGKELLMANLLLQSRGLVEKAKSRVKDSLDQKAWSIVDKYMWGAGGVAAVNPFPVIDLVAGSAISTKMIIDLADVYQQKVDLETASQWLSEMGKNLVGFLGAQGAAVAVSTVVASLIKSIPFAGTIAGGALQGAVQALITKWIGATFIEYFRNEMQAPEGGLASLARRQWEVVTTVDEIRKLVQTARKKLTG